LPPERQAELAQGDAEFDHAGRLTDQVAASFLNHSLKSTVEERFNWLAETIAPLRQAAINKMLEAKDISHKFEVEFQLLQNEVKNLNAQRPGPKAGAAAIEAFNNLVDRYNNKVQDYNDRLNRESGRWLSEAMQATGKLVKMNGPLAEFNKVAGGLLDGTAPSAGGIRWRQSAKGDAPVPQKTKLTQKELDIKVQAALALAFLAVKKANYDEALRYLQDARAAKPKDQKIRAAYLYVLSLKNRPPRIKPSSKATYLLDALDYGKGDWEKSLDYLNNIEFDRAGNVDAQAAEEALRNLKVVYAEFLARQAVDRISRKDFEGAMTSLKRANELDPDTDGHRHLLTCIQDTLEEMDRDRRTKKR
jgi:tetratricopeptide (TPR) repeat protein